MSLCFAKIVFSLSIISPNNIIEIYSSYHEAARKNNLDGDSSASKVRAICKGKNSSIKDELIEIRRTLHQYPELGFEETNTSKFIKDFLAKEGIEFKESEKKERIHEYII